MVLLLSDCSRTVRKRPELLKLPACVVDRRDPLIRRGWLPPLFDDARFSDESAFSSTLQHEDASQTTLVCNCLFHPNARHLIDAAEARLGRWPGARPASSLSLRPTRPHYRSTRLALAPATQLGCSSTSRRAARCPPRAPPRAGWMYHTRWAPSNGATLVVHRKMRCVAVRSHTK